MNTTTSSSNPGRDCILYSAKTFRKDLNPIILPPVMGKELSSLGSLDFV